jgi:hypothetical protein
MTTEPNDSIDDDVIAALRADARGGVPGSSRERVFRRLGLGAATLGATTTVTKGASALVASVMASPSATALVSTLGIGIAIGFGASSGLELIRSPSPPAKAAVVQVQPSRVPSAQPARAPSPAAALPAATPLASASSVEGENAGPSRRLGPPLAAVVSSAVPAPEPPPAGLAAQQSLLDDARRSLFHGDGANALAAIATHRRRFPDTALAEERAALEIRALLALGRFDVARERYTTFERGFPGSLFAPSLRDLMPPAVDSVTEPATAPQE